MPNEHRRSNRNLALGKRLKLARRALGYGKHGGQTSFATKAGIPVNTYNQWEKGASFPDLDEGLVLRLCDRYPGLTLDWIYRGEFRGMDPELTDRIMDELDGAPVPMAAPVQPSPDTPADEMKVVHVSRVGRRAG